MAAEKCELVRVGAHIPTDCHLGNAEYLGSVFDMENAVL